MGSPSHRTARWLWLALPLLGLFALLAAGRSAQATPAAEPPNPVFIPFMGKKGSPQFSFTPFASGLGNITITEIANAGDERLFVASREGKVWLVYPDGSVSPTPFLDATKLVQLGADGNDNDFEQGFLGMAFHPDYPATPYFYIAYTTPRNVSVARGMVSANNPNYANPSDIRVMLSAKKPDASGGPSPVHNAGDLTFGPDGYLYIPLGDGGPDPYDPLGVPGDPNNNAQRRDTLLGSILRIDVNPTRGLPQDCGVSDLYSIPPSNPWLGDAGCDEIWAKGLRNPWRIAIDPLNGDMYIADVGEWKREEVSYYPGGAPGGANFGWHCSEGTVDYTTLFPGIANTCKPDTVYVFPVHEYDHARGECSIIGGLLYRGEKHPALRGRYFFGDWCSGRLWTMVREGGVWQVEPAGDTVLPYSTFGEDIYGNIYAGVYMDGTVYKVDVR